MNSSNLFVLGLLLLTANLSLGALFSPSRIGRVSPTRTGRVSSPGAGRVEADRLLFLWKLLLLATIQIGSWAIVLDQGGAAPTLATAFTRAAACFALIGGSGGGLAAPWGEVAPFIALNGLLYLLLALLPLIRGSEASTDAESGADAGPPLIRSTPEKGQPSPAGVSKVASDVVQAPVSAKQSLQEASRSGPVTNTPASASGSSSTNGSGSAAPSGVAGRSVEASSASAAPSNGTPSPEPDFKPGGFRATIPKAASFNVQLSPEEELAEQMKPIGPTPPPIRFEWKN